MENSAGRGATYEDLSTDIDRVSRRVASDYPDIEWEDVRQELALFVLTNGKSIKLKEDGGNPRWLLTKVAQTYCKDQRTQHLTLSPQYAYTPGDVKKILEVAFDPELMTKAEIPDDAKSPLEGTVKVVVYRDENNETLVQFRQAFNDTISLEMTSDVKAAWERLKEDHKVAIFKRYALGWIPERDSYERKKLTAAIKELTHKLNSYRGNGNIKRRAISNAGARAKISEVYEGY